MKYRYTILFKNGTSLEGTIVGNSVDEVCTILTNNEFNKTSYNALFINFKNINFFKLDTDQEDNK